jgi:hypothetical protein
MESLKSEVKTYYEGGRGKKQCSKCYKYVAAVTKICACGSEFAAKTNFKAEISTFSTGGRGKKECPDCRKFVGAIVPKCVCGFDFKQAKISKKDALSQSIRSALQAANLQSQEKLTFSPEFASLMVGCKSTIIAPAGSCPHKLDSTEPEKIDEWISKVRLSFKNKQQFLTISGVIYFIHQFFNMFSPEYKTVREYVEKSLGSERSLGLS